MQITVTVLEKDEQALRDLATHHWRADHLDLHASAMLEQAIAAQHKLLTKAGQPRAVVRRGPRAAAAA